MLQFVARQSLYNMSLRMFKGIVVETLSVQRMLQNNVLSRLTYIQVFGLHNVTTQNVGSWHL